MSNKPKYSIGQKVIFVNEYGVCFGEKTIIAYDDHFVLSDGKKRYFYTPTDSPWCSTAESNLFPIDFDFSTRPDIINYKGTI